MATFVGSKQNAILRGVDLPVTIRDIPYFAITVNNHEMTQYCNGNFDGFAELIPVFQDKDPLYDETVDGWDSATGAFLMLLEDIPDEFAEIRVQLLRNILRNMDELGFFREHLSSPEQEQIRKYLDYHYPGMLQKSGLCFFNWDFLGTYAFENDDLLLELFKKGTEASVPDSLDVPIGEILYDDNHYYVALHTLYSSSDVSVPDVLHFKGVKKWRDCMAGVIRDMWEMNQDLILTPYIMKLMATECPKQQSA